MINKEYFVKCINFIKERDKQQQKINDMFTDEFEDSIFYPYMKYETAFVDLLSKVMEDDGEWISYFIYELDFGKNYKDGMVEDENGNYIPMGTAEELYDFLIKEKENK